MASTTATTPEGLLAQRELIAKLEKEGGWDIIIGDAFVRGMRDIGYKSTSYAVAELVDNAAQASATRVDIVFGFDGGLKPTQIAIIDDGYGMEPKMVRAALIWGAGTRARDRSGFGKYGYGLPSASVSQCQRVTVYSKTTESGWYSSYLDVDEISKGDPRWLKGNRLEIPEEKAEVPPAFVIDYLKSTGRWDSFPHGAVVVWDKLDRLNARRDARRDTLRSKLLSDMGVIYRNVLVNMPMTVDGEPVQPCDPLFLTPGFRGYDTDDDRAIALDPAVVGVKDKDTGEEIGKLRIRFSRLPATFFRIPEAKRNHKPSKKQMNERLGIADANHGIMFCRNGRQIDVVRPPRRFEVGEDGDSAGTSWNATTDRFCRVEVDFDATLDEFFSITTSKQAVRPHDSIWDVLKDKANLFTVVSAMRREYQKEADEIKAQADADKEQKRAAIIAKEQAEKFRTTKRPQDTPERREEAQRNLEHEVHRRAEQAGVSPEVVEREIIAEQVGVTRRLETEDLPGAPFYRCEQVGGVRVLYLNVAHPFYSDLYAGPGSTPRLRAGLEILLWTLGEAEVDADPGGDKRHFYEIERSAVWSPEIAAALQQLRGLPLMEEVADETTAA